MTPSSTDIKLEKHFSINIIQSINVSTSNSSCILTCKACDTCYSAASVRCDSQGAKR